MNEKVRAIEIRARMRNLLDEYARKPRPSAYRAGMIVCYRYNTPFGYRFDFGTIKAVAHYIYIEDNIPSGSMPINRDDVLSEVEAHHADEYGRLKAELNAMITANPRLINIVLRAEMIGKFYGYIAHLRPDETLIVDGRFAGRIPAARGLYSVRRSSENDQRYKLTLPDGRSFELLDIAVARALAGLMKWDDVYVKQDGES